MNGYGGPITLTRQEPTDVRRYCDECGSVSLINRRKRRCPVCGGKLTINKETQGSWGDRSYRPEITGVPPEKVK